VYRKYLFLIDLWVFQGRFGLSQWQGWQAMAPGSGGLQCSAMADRVWTRAGWFAVVGLAWLGYAGSLWVPGRVVVDGVRHDRSTSVTRVLYIEGRFEALGQTYRGHAGTWLAAVQIVVVVASLILAHVGRAGWRGPGVVGLVAWGLLWLGNAVVALVVAPGVGVVWVHLAFVAPPAACALVYCMRLWRRARYTPAP
jgi:hypothetical protein